MTVPLCGIPGCPYPAQGRVGTYRVGREERAELDPLCAEHGTYARTLAALLGSRDPHAPEQATALRRVKSLRRRLLGGGAPMPPLDLSDVAALTADAAPAESTRTERRRRAEARRAERAARWAS